MTGPLLRIAVVGHTNTGKTSLLRTLTRDVGFGEVSSRPATTRHVEASSLLITDLLGQIEAARGLLTRGGYGSPQPRINDFTTNQLIALRFASDDELPTLARKVLDENIVDQKPIKEAIKTWRPDYQRV